MSGEKPGFDPTEKSEGKSLFARLREKAIMLGAVTTIGGGLGGCSTDNAESQSQPGGIEEILRGDLGQSVQCDIDNEKETNNSELFNYLERTALGRELKMAVEGDEEMTKELSRIVKGEAAVYYAVQCSASTSGLEKKFGRVLKNEKYRKKINGYIRKYCEEFGVPYSVAYGVAANESSFEPSAESHTKAKGIFQMMDNTILNKDLQLGSGDEVENNIYAGIKYLSFLHERYGQWSIAMMAYSTGQNSFRRKLRDDGGCSYEEKYGGDGSHWKEFIADKKINAVTLYSEKYYGLGDIIPFQYPFYILSVTEAAEKIMQGELKSGELKDLVSPEDFRETCANNPRVVERIKRKVSPENFKEITKRLGVNTKN